MAGMAAVTTSAHHRLFGVAPVNRVILQLTWIPVALTILSAMMTLIEWYDRYRNPSGRLRFTLVMATALVFPGILHRWRLLRAFFHASVITGKTSSFSMDCLPHFGIDIRTTGSYVSRPAGLQHPVPMTDRVPESQHR